MKVSEEYENRIMGLVENLKKKDKPNFNLAQYSKKQKILGLEARKELEYLKQNRREIYIVLSLRNELEKYLLNVEQKYKFNRNIK